jgi:hypothetical protein
MIRDAKRPCSSFDKVTTAPKREKRSGDRTSIGRERHKLVKEPFPRCPSPAFLFALYAFYTPFMRCLAAAAYRYFCDFHMGGIMGSIFIALLFVCVIAFALSLLCLVEVSRGARAGTSPGEQEFTIAPFQFAGPASMIFWSEGVWACFLSRAEDVNSSRPGRGPSSGSHAEGNLKSKPARFLNASHRFFNVGIRG